MTLVMSLIIGLSIIVVYAAIATLITMGQIYIPLVILLIVLLLVFLRLIIE